MRRKIVGLVICAFALASLTSLISCSKQGSVPTYKGMTLSNANSAYRRAKNPKMLDDVDNHSPHDEELENDIEDIVTIDVQTDDEVKYYIRPLQTFIVEVHIDNPNNYEIQSFTLNGQKYANYMFKDGSTMELLLLETTAPATSGYVEYTIDAIKYIDGTEIKDVDMSKGDKSIKAGVTFSNGPTARVTAKNIGSTQIELEVQVTDTNNLIGENELAIYLTNGETKVDSKKLQVGNNSVKFENLSMSTAYEYGVVAVYDLVDGRNLHSEWLVKENAKTLSAFSIPLIEATKTSISFEITKNGELGTIDSISLFDASTGELVEQGDETTRSFTNLLSDHEYNVYIDFSYENNGTTIRDWTVKSISTNAKKAPTIEIDNELITDTVISADLTLNDEDGIASISSVQLFKNGELVSTNSSKEINFNNLEYYSDYELVITYVYDLNNGSGAKTETFKKNYKTSPHLELTSCRVINTSAVSEGDTIYLQIALTNPSNATPVSVVINGEAYNCTSSSTATRMFVEVVNDGQFEGGYTILTIEKVNVSLSGTTYSIVPSENNTSSIFINGVLEVVYIDFVNSSYESVDWCFYSKTNETYIMVILNNKTGYSIEEITFQEEIEGRSSTISNPTKIDDEHYLAGTVRGEMPMYLSVASLTYSNEYVSHATIHFNNNSYDPSKLGSLRIVNDYGSHTGGVNYINSVEDLKNMNAAYKYYELTTDLDLAGIEWVGQPFGGVFNGNGHKIKNLSFVGSWNRSTSKIGLFSDLTGIVTNLYLEDVMFLISTNDTGFSCGAICGDCEGAAEGIARPVISNCHVIGDSTISIQDKVSVFGQAGGLCGYSGPIEIKNCTNSASVSSSACCGGITGNGFGLYKNCINYGDVVSSNDDHRIYVGGISSLGQFVINCTNNGNITGYGRVAGIVANMAAKGGYIINCTNNGVISGRGGANQIHSSDSYYDPYLENNTENGSVVILD